MRLDWTRPRVAALGLVLANLVPLVGVAAFDWTLHTLLVVYWIESGVLGAAYVAKIRRAEGTDDPNELPDWEISSFGEAKKRSLDEFVGKPTHRLARYFASYFGGFWFIHGLFVVYGFPSEFPAVGFASPTAVALAAAGLTIHHTVSYRFNYLDEGEYERNGPVTLMVEPLQRILVLHVTIVLGSIPLSWFGAPTGALLVMVAMKTYFDLLAHRKEHERARSRVRERSKMLGSPMMCSDEHRD